MNQNPTLQRYNLLSQLFHWLVAALIIGLIVTNTLHQGAPDPSDLRVSSIKLHISLGILLFLVTIARILWARISPQPTPIDAPRWTLVAAKLAHLALNLATLLIPIFGYLRVVSKGRVAEFFGTPLPSIIGESPWINDMMHIFHGEPMEIFLYCLVGLHVAAALWHQYVRRDGSLERMLPWGGRPA